MSAKLIRFTKLFVAVAIVSTLLTAAMPTQQVFACQGPQGDSTSFFGIPPWHEYLQCDAEGGVDNLSIGNLEDGKVWLIGIAIFEALMRVGAIVAVAFVIRGGIKYIMSQGSPDSTATARKTIVNSLIGLVLLVMSSVITSFIMNIFQAGSSGNSAFGTPQASATSSTVVSVFNFVYGVSGAIAVLYIVLGAIKFGTSAGEPQKAATARNTIIYAVVGLIVVISATIITNTVLNRI